MSTARHRTLAASAGLVAALALSACGSNDPAEVAAPQGAEESSSSAGVDAAHNDVDAMFVAGMVPHHEGAIAMSELAEERAQSPQVKDLARRIAEAQGPEIELMQDMAEAWDVDLDDAGGHGGGHMGDDSEELEGLEGAPFDRAFLSSMVEHHEGAIPMSREVLEDGENPQAKELAAQILSVQEREIAEMEQLLTAL